MVRFIRTFVIGSTLVVSTSAAAQESAADAADYQRFEALVREHEQRLAEMRALEAEMEDLARRIRAQRRAAAAVAIRDLAPYIAQLDSEDYRARSEASDIIRRTLLQRMWQLGETQNMSAEATERLRRLIVETATLSQLAPLMLELDDADRDAIFALMETNPAWIAAALGREPVKMKQALENPPSGHDDAIAIVVAHLLSDHLRPYPQIVALRALRDVSHPMVREAVVGLIRPLPPDEGAPAGTMMMDFGGPNWINSLSNQNSAQYQALGVIRHHRIAEALPWLLGLLQRVQNWNHQGLGVLVDATVAMRVRAAVPHLHQAALRMRERDQNAHWGDENRFNIRSADNLMWGVAVMLEMDTSELGFASASAAGWGGMDNVYGFMANATREKAFKAIDERVRDAGPFADIPGMDEAGKALDTLIGPVQ